jgi:uncharacterized membrane protein YfcA
VPIGLSALVLALLIVAGASALQGAVGFGANLVAVPLLVLVDPVFVPVPTIAMAVLLTGLMATSEPEGARFRELGWAYAGRVPGTILGVLALSLVAQSDLQPFFGVLLLVAVAMSAVGMTVEPTAPVLTSAGLVSGFMGTAVSVGGPPLALVYQRSSGAELRGTLARYLMISSSFSLLVLALAGQMDRDDIVLAVLLAPGVVAGYLLAGPLKRPLDRGDTRTVVLALSGISAVAVLVSWAVDGLS